MTKALRAIAYTAGVWLLATSVGLAQGPSLDSAPEGNLDLLKWAFTQGGLVIVTLVILWSYRKDFKTVLQENREELQTVMKLAQDCSAHIAADVAAKREVAGSMERMGDVVERMRQRQGN